MDMEHKGSRRALIILDGFAGVSGLIGMLILLTDWPIHFPTSDLRFTPFSATRCRR
jgi:hypothetical protein